MNFNRSKQLAERINEVTQNGKWIANTNIAEQICSIPVEQATFQVKELNSIAMLVFHLTYYLKGVSDALKGLPLTIKDKYSFNMAPIHNEECWTQLKDEFHNAVNDFIVQVELLDDNQLNQTFVKEEYGTVQRNIEAMVEHCYYHLGQIVLLNKLYETSESS